MQIEPSSSPHASAPIRSRRSTRDEGLEGGANERKGKARKGLNIRWLGLRASVSASPACRKNSMQTWVQLGSMQ